jgi:hypothetical protein
MGESSGLSLISRCSSSSFRGYHAVSSSAPVKITLPSMTCISLRWRGRAALRIRRLHRLPSVSPRFSSPRRAI